MIDARVLVVVPTFDGKVSAWTMQSIFPLLPVNYQPAVTEAVYELHSDYINGKGGSQHFAEKLAALYDLVSKPFGVQLSDLWCRPNDNYFLRSRACADFLDSDATHLLFADADVSFNPRVVRAMIEEAVPLIGAPYPRKGVLFDRVYRYAKEGYRPEHTAFNFAFRTVEHAEFVPGKTRRVKVAGLGMGCTLLSRGCVEAMIDAYGLSLADTDPNDGRSFAMLFAPLTEDYEDAGKVIRNHKYREDVSFCERWRALGQDCWLYVGAEAPASHHGDFIFAGTPEGFAFDCEKRAETYEKREHFGDFKAKEKA